MKKSNHMKFLGRVLLSLVFLVAGIMKIVFFNETAGFVASVGLPLASLGVVVALIVELAGGLALIGGYKVKEASWVLIAFTVLVSIIFVWDIRDQNTMYHLLKNIAIIGGLLYVIEDERHMKK